MKDFNQSQIGLYPEDLIFDEKTHSFQKCDRISNVVEQEDVNRNNSTRGESNGGALNGLFQSGMLSKIFEGNELLSTLLASGGFKNSAQKNNLIMQALSNLSSQKQTKEDTKNKKENTQKIIIEEL